jgi:uncharacterized protein
MHATNIMNHTNELIQETSPYLLQHAHNPVNWYPWGEAALQIAKKENKPILVSIGYSACHWCHVMEKESFEDLATAEIMNQYFVNIKIDREERPDLDHIHMDALQAMTGSGGWPLNVFLTPDKIPFYGGTYFPPVAAYNRPSWKEVLLGVSAAFRERRTEMEAQGQTLLAHLQQSNLFGQANNDQSIFTEASLHVLFGQMMKSADKKEGGFGQAPKFPQTFSIQFLLRYYHFYKNEEALEHACLSLDKMIKGGIYDHIGGGFARYATDSEWLVPHFEKMLYDNALLIIVMSEAYQLTHKPLYKNTIEETLEFVRHRLLSKESLFYSALDADSEGEEGRYYVWSKSEITNLLESDAAIFCDYYDISEEGNLPTGQAGWEGRNIINTPLELSEFARLHQLEEKELEVKLDKCRKILLNQRNKRVPPLLDDKILLSWNALMNTALSKAYAATGQEHYRELAKENMQALLSIFQNGLDYFHTYKNGQAKYPAFLDDLAFLVQALIHLQEITGNQEYLLKAHSIIENIIKKFGEQATGFFFFTSADQDDVIIRKKEVYDGAVPSGNAVMAGNLLYLSYVFDNSEWRERSLTMINSLESALLKYPNSFGLWASLVFNVTRKNKEIVLTGNNFSKAHWEILHSFIPCRILQISDLPQEKMPLLAGKAFNYPVQIYLCENFRCLSPLNSVLELIQQIEN